MKLHAQALLFDNDGTLVSSLESVRRCWTRWAVEYGITAEQFGQVELHGRPAAGMRTVALATTHRADELNADLVVTDLSALSALATEGGVEITVRG